MWCEIRRHTLRHQGQGYWSALKVERASPPKVYTGKNNFLVFLPPMAARTQIDEWINS
jgi:hypothetical protein